VLLPLLFAAALQGTTPHFPPVQREFRGVWIATVGNIDWPSQPGLPVAQQKDELLKILDGAQALKLNAVIFQVRPAGDAMYESQLEPWSEYLTGRQGRAPSPLWDPLAFAVREAHARGLELHAWFNPFRAMDAGPRGELSPLHFARTHPSMAKRYSKLLWLDPGEEAVRKHTLNVILDVVKRYDIDGVHIDDYFYPYPEHDSRGRLVEFDDNDSYGRYRKGGGALARDDWRRENVNIMVESLNTEIHAVKPWVKFGISPFGIWRNGEPAGTEGLDAYTELFADARRWINAGWADYFSPQLYWPTTAPLQSYSTLLRWWGDQNYLGRHIWPGNFTSRVGTRPDWPASELVQQVLATRSDHTASGNVQYSAHALLNNQAGVADQLTKRVYADQALVPETPWLQGEAPPAPQLHVLVGGPLGAMACLGDPSLTSPRLWIVRVKQRGAWTSRVMPGAVREMSLGQMGPADSVALSGVDRTGREGAVTVGDVAKHC
jgi:uncharacterized lipoprotein YddW (UPF0748 family)